MRFAFFAIVSGMTLAGCASTNAEVVPTLATDIYLTDSATYKCIKTEHASREDIAGEIQFIGTKTKTSTARTTKPAPPLTDAQNQVLARWWRSVPKLEGDYKAWLARSENKDDRGGPTNHGVTWETFQSVRPNGTWNDFINMTESDAMKFGRGCYRASKAYEILDPGVAIMITDMYWMSFSPDPLNRALVNVGRKAKVKKAPLSAENIAEINAADSQKLIDEILNNRLQYFQKVYASDSTQRKYKGWITRTRFYWIQAKLVTGRAVDAAEWLNGQSAEEAEEYLEKIPLQEVALLHEAALTVVGPDSQFAKITHYRHAVYNFRKAMDDGDWARAAIFLNGLQCSDIQTEVKLIKLQRPKDLSKLHDAVVANYGSECTAAKLTTDSQNSAPCSF